MENLQEIKSDVIELPDIEFSITEFKHSTQNCPCIFGASTPCPQFTATRDGRFVWRHIKGNRLMVIDLILGVTRTLKYVSDEDDLEQFEIQCFSHLEGNFGLVLFDDFATKKCCVAKVHLDTESELLTVEYSKRLNLHNADDHPATRVSIDWWPSKRAAIILLHNYTPPENWCYIVGITQESKLEIRKLIKEFDGLMPVTGCQVFQRDGEEVLIYKGSESSQIVFAERNGSFKGWTESKWNSEGQWEFMNRNKIVRLSDSQLLFIRIHREHLSSEPRRGPDGIMYYNLVSYMKDTYFFTLFNSITGQFRDITMPSKLMSIFAGRNNSMFLSDDGILTVLVEKGDFRKERRWFVIRKVPLRKPEQLANLAALECVKEGVRTEQLPSTFVEVNPFAKFK